ncbi:MAG: hypothetical protein SXV54_18045 [Chloroflexota bacterium]|nr:hypothetical protein [Chloroflexota bacterium]
MPFRPQVDDQLTINDVTYSIAEHPSAPGVPYGQAGRRAIVYQVVAGDDQRALKVFSRRFRTPALVLVAQNLAPYASLPGLQVCQRKVLTPERHSALLQQHPDLAYAVLMPWIEGPTWMEAAVQKQVLTSEESLALARSLAETLVQMEERGLAHCDLSGPNVMLPALAQSTIRNPQSAIVLVDMEEMYGPDFERPEVLPSGSSGYGHRTAGAGLWGSEADRFAGAVLLAEMLGWCDGQVREAAWGEQYFAKEEVQEEGERYQLLVDVLQERWGENVAGLFERAWQSEALADCPAFEGWLTALPEEVGAAAVIVIEEVGIDEEEVEAEESRWKVVGEEEPEPELPAHVREQLVRAKLLAGDVLLQAGQPERAVAELEVAYEMNSEAAGELLARALVAQAQKAEEAGDREIALAGHRRAVEVAPQGSALREEAAAILEALEQPEMAAVAERIAAEVARLSDQMHEAFDAGQFEAAVAVGERLLGLQPDHSEGAKMLSEAQAKLAKRHELTERLEQERSSLDEAQQELAAERTRLTEQRTELEAGEERLATERAEAERHLEELQQAQVHCEKNNAEVREQLQALEKGGEEVGRRAVQLDQAAGLLERGELEQAEQLLTQPSEPPTGSHPGPGLPPARTEQRATDAGLWGTFAGLAFFCAIVAFAGEGDPSGGSILLLIAGILGVVALARSQSSADLLPPERSEENQT